MKTTYQEFIGRPEVSFWLPILFSAVTIALSFSALKNDVSLLNHRTEEILAHQVELSNDFKDWKSQAETRLGMVEIQQGVLNSRVTTHLSK
jgi:hypothetical protein